MKLVKKFQAGGAVPVETGAPVGAPQGEQDPMAQVVELFVTGLQQQNCEALAQGAQMFLQLIQEAQGGAGTPEGQPVFAKGGKLVSRKPVSFQLVRK